tara:strand:+ start:2473 stop:4221 length:1749 start_codon:yes stop_codon:yes gene_type:complete
MSTGAVIEVDFFNTYMVRRTLASDFKLVSGEDDDVIFYRFSWPAIATGVDIASTTELTAAGNDAIGNPEGEKNWYIEESRIRGGYNSTFTDQGVRAYLDEEYPQQQRRISTLIYSGIYNSRTGINQTNVFSVGDAITRSLDPVHGSIQLTHAEETNLIVFQENRIHRALIDKDTIYTTESGTQTQAGQKVIGQFVPYKGEYGISKNPESFAIYNYRKYFSDKSRNAIMRLSNDGLTEISMYGMRDYFRDELAEISNEQTLNTFTATWVSEGTTGDTLLTVNNIESGYNITAGMYIQSQIQGYVTNIEISGGNTIIYYSNVFSSDLSGTLTFVFPTTGQVKGGFDIHAKNYVLSLQKNSSQASTARESYKTLAFDEEINGWVSFFTYKPVALFSILNKFYTIGKGSASINSSQFYQQYFDTPGLNERGVFYNSRSPSNVTFIFNPQPDVMKNFNTISYEGSNGWEVVSYISGFTGQDVNPDGTSSYVQNNDKILSIKSYNEGLYTDINTGQPFRAGFDRKENRYVANLVNNSTPTADEIIFGNKMSGIKGYFATVKIETDETTQLGGPKELWSSATNFVTSSY